MRSRDECELDWLRLVASCRSGRLALGQLRLARLDVTLSPLDRCSLELDGSELLTALAELLLCSRELVIALCELAQVCGELLLSRLEVGRSEPKHPLDGRPRVA